MPLTNRVAMATGDAPTRPASGAQAVRSVRRDGRMGRPSGGRLQVAAGDWPTAISLARVHTGSTRKSRSSGERPRPLSTLTAVGEALAGESLLGLLTELVSLTQVTRRGC